MRFIDEARVRVAGGNGGRGALSWHREKFVPRGGPDGGNGGSGGAVVFVTDPGLNTLIDFSFSPEAKAPDGGDGEANRCDGKDGTDVFLKIPVGTQVFYGDQLAADLSQPGSSWIAARGGRGGKGNAHFKSSTNQAPHYAQPGCCGEAREYRLVLKSVADVGLVGMPNAGKSTLVSVVSKAQPKIADYPFTTVRPSLGVVLLLEGARFVIADIPGLIPGAHEGKGLGLQFLRHVERTCVLAQLIDVSEELHRRPGEGGNAGDEEIMKAAMSQFEAIDHELRMFSPALAEKPRVVVFSKADIPENRRAYEICSEAVQSRGWPVMLISSSTGEGLEEFKRGVHELVSRQRSVGL